MTDNILVAYASRTGWTAGVAEALARTLAEGGAQAAALPMSAVQDLSAYDAVVAGSAIQGRAWLPEAMQFVRAHQRELKAKPFAAFLVCMTLAMPNGETYRPQVSAWLDPLRALVTPLSVGLFAGGLDLRKMENYGDRLKFKLSVMLGVWKEGDHRDWQAIARWADELRSLLPSETR